LSTQPSGPTTLAQLIALAIASAQQLVNIINQNAVAAYQQQKANVIQWNQTMPANLPQAPLPQPPTIYLINTAAVTAGETADCRW
jgi:hypothetical protein